MLSGYFDASYTQPIGVSVIAGHLATSDQWSAIEAEWIANLRYWKLDYFHLADVIRKLGHENGSLCIRSFARIISKSSADLHGVMIGIRDADWDDYISKVPGGDQIFPSRYHALCDMLFRNLGKSAQLKGAQIAVVADIDDARTGVTQALFDFYAQGEHKEQLVSLTFARSQKIVPLQIADLHAGLQQKYASLHGFLSETATPVPFRFEFGEDWDLRSIMWASGRSSEVAEWSYEIARRVEETRGSSNA